MTDILLIFIAYCAALFVFFMLPAYLIEKLQDYIDKKRD